MPSGTPVPSGASIFIVEDEGIIAEGIEANLRKTGYQVTGIAASGEEALIQIAEARPDLILMDIRLRGEIDGIETARRVRQRFDLPVIYLTAHTDMETIARAKITGPFAYLSKPILPANLPPAIEVALERHRLEREVRRQRAWFSTVLRNMGDAVIVTDAAGMVQFLNPRATQLTGWNADEAREEHVCSVLSLRDVDSDVPSDDLLFSALLGDQPVTIPLGLHAIDRSQRLFPIEGEIAPSLDRGRVLGAVVTFRDASTRHQEESEIRVALKNEAVSRLAGGIAHDFNNLLTLILGYTDQALHSLPAAAPQLAVLNEVMKAGETAASITRQLLAFSEKRVSQPAVVDLNEVIRDSEGILRRSLRPNMELRIELAPDLGCTLADPDQIVQLVTNLVNNGADSMPEGGVLAIETSEVELPTDQTEVPGTESYIVLRVKDTGPGMAAEIAEHLFDPFLPTKQPGLGTGLGLAIVRAVVSDLGGVIHVESTLGEGAAFTVYLPRTAGAHRAPSVLRTFPEGTKTVLLVEDDDSVRYVLRNYLDGAGYNLLEAADGHQALAVASHYSGQIDALVTDVMMPRMNGLQLYRQLSASRTEMKTIFVSGYSNDLIHESDLNLDRTRFLRKPFLKAQLLQQVRELLGEPASVVPASVV